MALGSERAAEVQNIAPCLQNSFNKCIAVARKKIVIKRIQIFFDVAQFAERVVIKLREHSEKKMRRCITKAVVSYVRRSAARRVDIFQRLNRFVVDSDKNVRSNNEINFFTFGCFLLRIKDWEVEDNVELVFKSLNLGERRLGRNFMQRNLVDAVFVFQNFDILLAGGEKINPANIFMPYRFHNLYSNTIGLDF